MVERLSEQGRQGRRRRFPAQPWQATEAAAEPAANPLDCGAGGHAAQPAEEAGVAATAAGAQHQRAAQPADVVRPAARPKALADAPGAAAVWDDSDDAELAGWAEASAAAARAPRADAARLGASRDPPPAAAAPRGLGKRPIDRNSAMRRLLSEMKVRAARVAAPCPAGAWPNSAAEEQSDGESASAQVALPPGCSSLCAAALLPYPSLHIAHHSWRV